VSARRVSIITVTFNSSDLVVDALRSAVRAAEAAGFEPEVVVVDNASADGSADIMAEALPTARIIRNATNVGFGVANNEAFEVATGDMWLLLNPDARLDPGAIGTLGLFLTEHPAAAAAAPSIRGPGQVESAGMLPGIRSFIGHYLFVNRLIPAGRGGPWRGFALPRRPGFEPRRVEWASAAALALRPAAVAAVGGFDRHIFLYGEDIDLCQRLGAAGWQVWLVPAAGAEHTIGGSHAGVSTRWIDGLHAYLAARRNGFVVRLADLLLAIGLAGRALASRRDTAEAQLHGRRLAAAARRALRLAISGVRGDDVSEAPDPLRPGSTH
jgi:N-acetylglucosaminyl-diphospho-decaprenol L-rhamnosyltransferase